MGKVNCEHLRNGESCSAILGNEEAKIIRSEACENDNEEACCYLCSFYNNCEISCSILGENKNEPKRKQRITEKTEAILKPRIPRCPLCNLKMRHARMSLRVGGWEGVWKGLPLGIGELGEIQEELLPVVVYVCPKCGKLEFVAEEKTRQKIIDRS
jgi:hypothetical protein